jgi:EREBP-like factor|uniref:AP2/ERF domain-containing protein n=1 Tax=Fagus sylvatica TaxID=28930 RepID=A0A2N9FF11_FAGSY
MNIFSQYSDPHPFDSNTDSFSDSGTSTSARSAVHSDEEVILASRTPKKIAGRKIFKETRHPVYRGVRKRNKNKWVCEVREPNKKSRIWLGTYPTPEMAARAHDVAALVLKGKSACLNFADSAWRLRMPASNDAMEIRRAAAEAAESFRPREFGGECDDQEVLELGSCSESVAEMKASVEENVVYVDDEAVFDMPGLLVNMAEGLLLSPPPCIGWDDMEGDAQVSLWSF